MRYSATLVRSPWAAAFLLCGAAWAAGPVAFNSASLELGKARITVASTSTGDDFKAALDALQNGNNWVVTLNDKPLPIQKILIDVRTESVFLELSPSDLPYDRLADIPTGKLTVTYAPITSKLTIATGSDVPKPPTSNFLSRCFRYNLTNDKRNADIDITGGWQAGVGAKPQYYWSVNASCPMVLLDGAKYGTLGPTFTGQASQEHNADPDSLKAGFTYRKDFAPENSRNGWQIVGDVLSYEFERNVKAALALDSSGNPIAQPYLEKDSNLMWTGIVRYVNANRFANWTLGVAGFEAGRSLTRTVTQNSQSSGNQPVARMHFDFNVYKTFFSKGNAVVTFHGYEDLRLPFEPEPYVEAGVNGGDLYLTTKPRHWSLVEMTWAVTKGFGINFQYKRGSLPPSFQFVNHQLTVGFNLQLKRQ